MALSLTAAGLKGPQLISTLISTGLSPPRQLPLGVPRICHLAGSVSSCDRALRFQPFSFSVFMITFLRGLAFCCFKIFWFVFRCVFQPAHICDEIGRSGFGIPLLCKNKTGKQSVLRFFLSKQYHYSDERQDFMLSSGNCARTIRVDRNAYQNQI